MLYERGARTRLLFSLPFLICVYKAVIKIVDFYKIFLILYINYDCTGSMLKLWNGVGESRAHSSEEAVWLSIQNSGVDWKNAGTG